MALIDQIIQVFGDMVGVQCFGMLFIVELDVIEIPVNVSLFGAPAETFAADIVSEFVEELGFGQCRPLGFPWKFDVIL